MSSLPRYNSRSRFLQWCIYRSFVRAFLDSVIGLIIDSECAWPFTTHQVQRLTICVAPPLPTVFKRPLCGLGREPCFPSASPGTP